MGSLSNTSVTEAPRQSLGHEACVKCNALGANGHGDATLGAEEDATGQVFDSRQ